MSEVDERFVIEIGSGTVVHIIDLDADQDGRNARFSFGIGGPGEMMCSHGNRHPRPQHVPISEFLAHNDIDKDGFHSSLAKRQIARLRRVGRRANFWVGENDSSV
jgi:hypothetical protein